MALKSSDSALVLKSCLAGSKLLGSGRHEVKNGRGVAELGTFFAQIEDST